MLKDLELTIENRINSAIDFLIENSFTNINRKLISLEIKKNDSYFMATINNKILVSTDCSNLNKKALIGVLAHELVHMSEYQKSPIKDLLRRFLYNIPFYRTKLERNIDLEVIQRGLGEYLLEFLEYHDKHYKKYNKTDGLTKKEVTKLLQTIIV
ncbi:hypothetical protein [Chryseobacterium indoltheticum]|uniref:Peptidase M48 domain-containing protein n=1 Tax=Chryseobacterium indoltheticum TaxID=254 RepID=A0A381FQ42_9FLAO|nr:hypothetical protein [Chryseobacterium indoltheticum]SUX48720.1 Uncharacterised protein [Chryseobacterium indoltheticum]